MVLKSGLTSGLKHKISWAGVACLDTFIFGLRQCCSAQFVRGQFKVNHMSSKLNILFPS